MQLVWQKGKFSWIASRPERDIDFSPNFPQIEPPDNAQVLELCAALLSYGGEAVVVLFEEENANELFARHGEIVNFKSLKFKIGEERQCHENSAKLWKSNEDKFCLMTGYGLSDDGLWRRHSWVIDDEADVVETTLERTLYFGIRLNRDQANAFWQIYK